MIKQILLVTVTGIFLGCGTAAASTWSAEALGEGSGLDRGAFASAASGSAGAAQASAGSEGLKESRRDAIEADLAESLAINDARLNEMQMLNQGNIMMGQEAAISAARAASFSMDGIHGVPAGE